jgi:hypothetical protein
VRTLRVAFALLGLIALVASARDSADLAHYFSFFTIESNVLAVVVLLIGGLLDRRSAPWAYLRAAVTTFMVITGAVYAALLSKTDVGLIAPWINHVLHQVMPAALALDYLLFGPWPRVSYRAMTGILLGPLVYLAYSLVRGPRVHWYPYPFLNPHHASGGYGRVALNCVVLGVLMALLTVVINWVARRRGGTAA